MMKILRNTLISTLLTVTFVPTMLRAQDGHPVPPAPPTGDLPSGPPGGMMGGTGMGQARKIVARFDANGDGWLNIDERMGARNTMKLEAPVGGQRGGRRGPGGMGGRPPGMQGEPVGPGQKVNPREAKSYPDASLFEPTVLRTLFLDFESEDWEAELSDFHNTDVDVPCTLTVDGKTYPNVGVHFRGASSYMMIGSGHKRSLNLSTDLVDDEQRLYGAKTLNLLNAHEDPSFMSSILYAHLARQHIPAPKANFVKVVINGESWGIYASLEQFNRDFIEENFGTAKGARWKVKGSPQAAAGLDYTGEDLEPYQRRYQIKNGDDEDDWNALVELCRVLTETPIDELEQALTPIFDIDGALWFLALDNALVNCDGYWIRSSDYNLYRDPEGVFHLIPHDMNESFVSVVNAPGFGGRGRGGMRGGPGGPGSNGPGAAAPGFDDPPPGMDRAPDGEASIDRPQQPTGGQTPQRQPGPRGNARPTGIELDPLIGMNDARKPLRSRLLAVPSLREKYLQNVRAIAESLAWNNLGPVVAQYRALIEGEVEIDTRKLTSFAAFEIATADAIPPAPVEGGRPPRSLRAFADGRSRFLLEYQPKSAAAPTELKEQEQ